MSTLKLLHHAQFHGANRLADRTSRWYFIPALLMLLGSSIILVMLTINRYQENPAFMVQIDELPAAKPFPSVWVCPEINFIQQKMDQFLSELSYPAGMNASHYRRILPQLAAFYAPDVPYAQEELVRVEQLLIHNNISVETAGVRLTASCEKTLIKCRWGRTMMNCSEIFTMEMTGDGLCCVFNARSLRREMKENPNYKKNFTINKRWYTSNFGYTSGLMIAVNQSQKPSNIDLSYKWVALATNQHFVDTGNNGTALNPGHEQWIAYFANGYQVSDEVKALSPSLRKCLMSDDPLLYFPVYKKKYCLLECEMALSLKHCNCVRTVHPKPPGTVWCRAHMLRCTTNAMVSYDYDMCPCRATCDVDVEFTKATSFRLNPDVKPLDPFYNGLVYDKVSVVRIFIQKRRQKVQRRSSYYTYLDLFSQIGGVFNVNFGCSILTILGLLQLGWRVVVTQWRRLLG